MARFLDLSVNGIALGAVSGGTNQTQALLSTATSNVLQLSGTDTSTLCRITGVDQPTTDSDAANRLYVQSYVQGQIRGLQMKPSVKLCSTDPVDLTSADTHVACHWPGPIQGGASNTSQDFWEFPDDVGHILMLGGRRLTTGTQNMSMGFIWTPSVAKSSATTSAVQMQWLFHGARDWASGDAGGITMNMGDPLAMIYNSFTGDGGTLGPYDDLRVAWSSVTPGTQFCFLWTYQHYPLNPNDELSPGTMSITWGTLVDGGITELPDYRNGRTMLYKAAALPSGFGNADASVEANYNLKGLRILLGDWPSTCCNVFYAPGILNLYDAFIGAWQPPRPRWLDIGIDGGCSVMSGDRILLTCQGVATDNGIWVMDSSGITLVRPPDYLTGSSAGGSFVFVDGPGVANNGEGYLCTSAPNFDIVDECATTWAQYTTTGGHIGTLVMGTDTITTASGTLSFVNNNLTTTGTVSSTATANGSLSMQAGNINDYSGQINFGSTNTVTTGSITAPHFLTVSDERLKEVTADLEITPDIYAALHPVCFNWKASGLPDVGLIAQEVMTAAPQVVSKDTNSPEGYLYIDYTAIVPYALAIAKGATDRVAALEARVAALEPAP